MSQASSDAAPAAAKTSQPEATARLRLAVLPYARVLPAILAVGLAAFAERLAADARTANLAAPPAASWLLFGLAAILFLPAVWPVPRLSPAVSPAFGVIWQVWRRRPAVYIPLALAILCGLTAIPLFTTINNTPAG